MRKTRPYQAITLSISLLFKTSFTFAEPNIPVVARVKITRTLFRLEFQWNKKNPPNFDPGTAVEFQTYINPKCFAQPLGGKDNESKISPTLYPQNFPVGSKPYVDVWNYWIPGSADELIELIGGRECGGLNFVEKLGIKAKWEEIVKQNQDNKNANFAIGLVNADALNSDWEKRWQGTERGMYFFEYPLSIPPKDECLTSADPTSGGASVSMQYFPNVCHFLGFVGTHSCPEMLGLPQCSGGAGTTKTWIRRLCVPTNFYPFIPGNAKETLPWGVDGCYDDDHDGFFAIQSAPMVGLNLGDCNDHDSKITNERYNSAINQCLPEPITPCTGKDPGLYCSSTLPGYTGAPTDLVYCKDNIVQMQGGRSCMHGCQVQPPGIDDYCKPPPNPCGAPCMSPLVCSTSGCVARCGEQNQPCCEPGQTCDILGEKSFCDSRSNFYCRPCGKTDQACCPGANPCYLATYGLSVYCDKAANMCWPCGDRGQRCCKIGQQCALGATCVLDAPPDDYRCR
jgi:hypothetical protein